MQGRSSSLLPDCYWQLKNKQNLGTAAHLSKGFPWVAEQRYSYNQVSILTIR